MEPRDALGPLRYQSTEISRMTGAVARMVAGLRPQFLDRATDAAEPIIAIFILA
jgi:hypothetical protein